MAELRASIVNVARSDATVVIRGATGTGKELVARSLHEGSRRREGRFVPVNCGAITDTLSEDELFGHEKWAFTGADRQRFGYFEQAHNGTLFLDEIESMPLNVQTKLLRVLEQREVVRVGSSEATPVDFRLVAATQTDLLQACERNEFRRDLYYRLDVAELRIPALAERREDIPLLLESFLQELSARHERPVPEISSEYLSALLAHEWPGNVRELRNVAERRVLGLTRGTRTITENTGPIPLRQQLVAFERSVIMRALRNNRGGKKETSHALSIPTRTLHDRIQKYHLNETP